MLALRVTAAALVTFACACSPWFKPTEPARTWSVAPASLVRSYQDYSDRWTDQRVTVLLVPKDYVISGHEVHWHFDRKADPPTIVFVFSGPPAPDNTRPIEITGHCEGRVFDKRRRGNGQEWHVRIQNCTAVIR